MPAIIALIERARALTGEPALGFYLGLQMSISAHGYLGFAAMSAPTLREALTLAIQYAPIRTTSLVLHLDVRPTAAALVIDERADLGSARDVVLLGLLVGIWRIGNALLGRDVGESIIDVTFPEPDYYARFRRTNPRVRFSQPSNRLVFEPALLDAPLVSADPAALRLAQDQCERLLESLGSDSPVVDRVRRLVLRRDTGVRSFEELAAAVRVSPRTLRRRLADAQVSFSTLLDEARRDRALLLLRSRDVSTKDVAERVGYSNVANFMRAFRRWTGRTPAAYRRESGVHLMTAGRARSTGPARTDSEFAERGDAVACGSELRRRDVHGLGLRGGVDVLRRLPLRVFVVARQQADEGEKRPDALQDTAGLEERAIGLLGFAVRGRIADRTLREVDPGPRERRIQMLVRGDGARRGDRDRRKVRDREEEEPRPQQRILRLASTALDAGRRRSGRHRDALVEPAIFLGERRVRPGRSRQHGAERRRIHESLMLSHRKPPSGHSLVSREHAIPIAAGSDSG